MKKLLLSILLFLPLISFGAEKDNVTFPDGIRHGTVFQVSDKILSGLQNIVIAPDQQQK